MRKTRILYLPLNVASIPGITADAMNNCAEAEAICLSIGEHKYLTPSKHTIEIKVHERKNVFRYLRFQFQKYYLFFKYIFWADVIHFVWDSTLPMSLELRLIKWLKKPGVIEWLGSDIRCPSKSFPINPYLKAVFLKGYEHAKLEDDRKSLAVQKKFRSAGLEPACCPEMLIYVADELFPCKHLLFQRINTAVFTPHFPASDNPKPLIVHSPSAKVAKGSERIIEEIEKLKGQYDFDFVLLHDRPRQEVHDFMRRADFVVDQIIVGGYGMAAMEAMSFGKPVLCYLMPALYVHGLPADCPVINTNPDNLRENLIKMISNPALRYETGKKSRAFVETYHDADKMAPSLLKLYRDVAERSKIKR